MDTGWYYTNEEELKALESLVADLGSLKAVSILRPDKGIYRAAKKHARDEREHNWTLLHTGSDGSGPQQRIHSFSPLMTSGNENIGSITGSPSPRDIVLMLLVDSGIPGYGHRYNMLDPQWSHIGCAGENFAGSWWWVQDLGK